MPGSATSSARRPILRYVGLATVRFTFRRIRNNGGDRFGATVLVRPYDHDGDGHLEDGMTQSDADFTDDAGEPEQPQETGQRDPHTPPEDIGQRNPHLPTEDIGRENPHEPPYGVSPAIGHRDPH